MGYISYVLNAICLIYFWFFFLSNFLFIQNFLFSEFFQICLSYFFLVIMSLKNIFIIYTAKKFIIICNYKLLLHYSWYINCSKLRILFILFFQSLNSQVHSKSLSKFFGKTIVIILNCNIYLLNYELKRIMKIHALLAL